jgi:hypothetical protein
LWALGFIGRQIERHPRGCFGPVQEATLLADREVSRTTTDDRLT